MKDNASSTHVRSFGRAHLRQPGVGFDVCRRVEANPARGLGALLLSHQRRYLAVQFGDVPLQGLPHSLQLNVGVAVNKHVSHPAQAAQGIDVYWSLKSWLSRPLASPTTSSRENAAWCVTQFSENPSKFVPVESDISLWQASRMSRRYSRSLLGRRLDIDLSPGREDFVPQERPKRVRGDKIDTSSEQPLKIGDKCPLLQEGGVGAGPVGYENIHVAFGREVLAKNGAEERQLPYCVPSADAAQRAPVERNREPALMHDAAHRFHPRHREERLAGS